MSERVPPQAAVDEALVMLGLSRGMSWDSMRQAYRQRLRDHHPDVDPAPGATARTAALTAAWTVLSRATAAGALPLEPVEALGPSEASRTHLDAQPPAKTPVILIAPPGDVFVHLLEAASAIGDVSYMDPEAGLIQVLLDNGNPAGPQLLIAIDSAVTPASVSFTLDAASAESAPDVHTVVESLADHLASIQR